MESAAHQKQEHNKRYRQTYLTVIAVNKPAILRAFLTIFFGNRFKVFPEQAINGQAAQHSQKHKTYQHQHCHQAKRIAANVTQKLPGMKLLEYPQKSLAGIVIER